MTDGAALLFDQACGFCRWSVATVLRHDPVAKLRPVPIQGVEGAQLLSRLPPERRLANWHLVLRDGTLYSGDAALQPLLDLLEYPPEAHRIARVARALGGPQSRRRVLGRFVSSAALRRADALIAARLRDGGNDRGADSTEGRGHAEPRELLRAAAAAPRAPEREPIPVAAEREPTPVAAPPIRREPQRRGWQQRFEESAFGRGILSCLLVVTLIAIVADNIPGSALKEKLLKPGLPYLSVLGLDQNWALFAPDPRQVSIVIYAIVAFEDGKTVRWYPPSSGSLVGAYRDYRWRKWEEQITGSQNSVTWRPAAIWAAQRMARPGHYVTRVALMERFTPIQPPGVTPETGTPVEHLFYLLNINGGTVKR